MDQNGRPDNNNNSNHQQNVHLHMHHVCACQNLYPASTYYPPISYRTTPLISYAAATPQTVTTRPYLQHYQYTQFNVGGQYNIPMAQMSSASTFGSASANAANSSGTHQQQQQQQQQVGPITEIAIPTREQQRANLASLNSNSNCINLNNGSSSGSRDCNSLTNVKNGGDSLDSGANNGHNNNTNNSNNSNGNGVDPPERLVPEPPADFEFGGAIPSVNELFMMTNNSEDFQMNTDSFIKFLERSCLTAEQIAYRNRNRPCFRNIQNLCIRTRSEILKPRTTISNIHSQGIPWATKDFIYAFVRLTNCWHILKGYWENREGSALGKIEKELTPGFKACYVRWEKETVELATELTRIFYNLDVNQSNPGPSINVHTANNLIPPQVSLLKTSSSATNPTSDVQPNNSSNKKMAAANHNNPAMTSSSNSNVTASNVAVSLNNTNGSCGNSNNNNNNSANNNNNLNSSNNNNINSNNNCGKNVRGILHLPASSTTTTTTVQVVTSGSAVAVAETADQGNQTCAGDFCMKSDDNESEEENSIVYMKPGSYHVPKNPRVIEFLETAQNITKGLEAANDKYWIKVKSSMAKKIEHQKTTTTMTTEILDAAGNDALLENELNSEVFFNVNEWLSNNNFSDYAATTEPSSGCSNSPPKILKGPPGGGGTLAGGGSVAATGVGGSGGYFTQDISLDPQHRDEQQQLMMSGNLTNFDNNNVQDVVGGAASCGNSAKTGLTLLQRKIQMQQQQQHTSSSNNSNIRNATPSCGIGMEQITSRTYRRNNNNNNINNVGINATNTNNNNKSTTVDSASNSSLNIFAYEMKNGGLTKRAKGIFDNVIADLKTVDLKSAMGECSLDCPNLDTIHKNVIKDIYRYVNEVVKDLRYMVNLSSQHVKNSEHGEEQQAVKLFAKKLETSLVEYFPNYDFNAITGKRQEKVGKLKIKNCIFDLDTNAATSNVVNGDFSGSSPASTTTSAAAAAAAAAMRN